MKKYMIALLAGLLLVGGYLYAANDPIHRLTVRDSEVWKIDEEGDVTAAGSITAPDGTFTDDVAITDTLSVTGATTLSTATVTGGFRPRIATKAIIASLTSTTTGQLVICSDCTRSYLCVSSGTLNPDSYVVAVETGTIVGGPKTKCQ